MNGFAVVASFLLIPPVSMRISELALDSRGVDVASILFLTSVSKLPPYERLSFALRYLELTWFGSSASVRTGGSGYFSSRIFWPCIE